MNRYQQVFFSMLIVVLVVGLCSTGLAQRIVDVAPTEFGILNKVIDGDTTAGGARVDSNTVYRLERGTDKYYVLDGSIQNNGYHLTIIANDEEGDRPKLVPGVATGGESSRPFRPAGDLTLKGLYISGKDDKGGLPGRLIRINADDITIDIDDCHLDYDDQSAFRFDTKGVKVFLRNSIVSNIGTTSDPNNGRGFDDRGNNIDTIVVEHCTFYNITSRVLRDDGGWIKLAKFDHNTFINIGQWMLTFGEVADAQFTNNMVINGAFFGNGENDTGPNYWLEVDSLKNTDLINAGYTQSVNISYNNFYLDPAIVAAYPDTVDAAELFSPTAQAFIDESGMGATNLNEAITFTLGPAAPADVVTAIWAGATEVPPMDPGTAGEYGQPGYGTVTFDLAYPTGTASYTGAMAGRPLGDLNWFGMATSVENYQTTRMPKAFRLLGNYPNPFNPSTNIRFDLDKPAIVTITVYDNLGRKVLSTQPKKMNAGNAQVINLNAAQLATGMYMYKINANTGSDNYIGIGRMLLLK